MPATIPGTRRDQVLTWLAEHPGYHKPVQVGVGVGCTTHQAATTLLQLHEAGRVKRLRISGGRPQSVYASSNT